VRAGAAGAADLSKRSALHPGVEDNQTAPSTSRPRPEGRRVGQRVVEADCLWLRWALNWATRWRYPDVSRLLQQNGTIGLEVPTEKNPKRPVASDDRYEATRAVSDQVPMEIRWEGRRRRQRSYLSELLDIANGTARRITAICGLRYHDLHLESEPGSPHGAIRWPENTDRKVANGSAQWTLSSEPLLIVCFVKGRALGPLSCFRHPAINPNPCRRTWRLSGCVRRSGSLDCPS
jgi:hypothetical protein